MLTQARARELFTYADGALYWNVAKRGTAAGTKAGSVSRNGYVFVTVDGRHLCAHRIIYLMHHGELPTFIDHIDGNPSNNLINNLRPATHQENLRNRAKQRNNTSGYKGVSFNKLRGNWRAQIQVNGRTIHLGSFDTPEDAALIYAVNALRHFGDFARF